jgi:hypothetical protein
MKAGDHLKYPPTHCHECGERITPGPRRKRPWLGHADGCSRKGYGPDLTLDALERYRELQGATVISGVAFDSRFTENDE